MTLNSPIGGTFAPVAPARQHDWIGGTNWELLAHESDGLARIQWEGPWTNPGVPMRVRYRHTHWVGAARSYMAAENVGIFDINCINNGSGWVSLKDWREIVVPHILGECVPRANGKWHVTHAIEVEIT